MLCGLGAARRARGPAGSGRTGAGGGSPGGRAVSSTPGAPGESLLREAAWSSPSLAGRYRAWWHLDVHFTWIMSPQYLDVTWIILVLQVEDPSESRRFVCRIKERMEGECH